MRLSFSSDQQDIRDAFDRVFLTEAKAERARAAVASEAGWDIALWRQLAELGWFGVAVAERFGGLGQEPLALCLVAESVGRRFAAIPFAGAVLGFADALTTIGDETLSDRLLPQVVTGEIIGGIVTPASWSRLAFDGKQATGHAPALPDGAATTHALTLCGAGSAAQLLILDLNGAPRKQVDSLDRINIATSLDLEGAPATVVASGMQAELHWNNIVNRYAIFLSFVQVGAAMAALDAAREHVIQRYAFGRPLGSFQAIKHGLADVLALTEVARSNAWFAAASLGEGGDLTEVAAAARVSATDACRQSARALVHYLGGLGTTAESDAHLHYRRAQALGVVIGSPALWREKFMTAALARVGAHAHTALAA